MHTETVQNALIIGGGSGMGRAVAQTLAAAKIDLFVADRNLEAARKTASVVASAGQTARALEVDIARSQSVAELFQTLHNHTERLDLMVHTAGILGRTLMIEEMADEDWRRMMSVNLDGVFYCCREAVRWMKSYRTGRIILFSSVAALTPTPGALHYSAAKGGVNMLGKTLAKEVAKYNIRVNIVAPGYVETPLLDDLPQGFDAYICRQTPLKRMGSGEEIAGLVSFLASPAADFITGQVISPNGGFVI